ncbi:unnamed protein product [Gongylonema pulchrum]|uniref:Retrotransposon protein n=1 Tax=Gongylonema pulchrum TaxID=637853 RepID=A0A183DWB1_9BILA|nr:unnamed protein product [Gongylonema pulchrum]
MKDELKEINNRVGKNDGKVSELTQIVETNETVQRSLNLRIYGFEYAKCKLANQEDPKKFDVVSLKELIVKMIVEGMKLPENIAKGMIFRKCHWVSRKYVLCGFTSAEDKQIFNKGEYNLKSYVPHGHPLSIKGEPAKQQTQEYQDATATALQLRTKGHVAFATECRIRIGAGPTAKWYHHMDFTIQQRLTAGRP